MKVARILVIKQTSLGDVLHSTGHMRCIRQQFPDAHITLLTANTSVDIYRDNPNVDRIVEFQRYEIKKRWLRNPLWSIGHFAETFRQVGSAPYDLAIDLQGRWKSALFLYRANSKRKFIKGNWPFLTGFRDRSLHALKEMDGVLELAGINSQDNHMDFYCSAQASDSMQAGLANAGLGMGKYIVLSPFTRWPSKNWSLDHYAELISRLPKDLPVVVSGAGEDHTTTKQFLAEHSFQDVINFCGQLSLQEFAELVRNARVVVSGDSFAMHVAAACNTSVVALFGPTDEVKVGPTGSNVVLLRGNKECAKCYQHLCAKRCIDSIATQSVCDAVLQIRASSSSSFGKIKPAT
ncbi:MAG: heptosyltransferase-2 [Parasphingorhabdus sp.]|jgi:heptosyltransferase-2